MRMCICIYDMDGTVLFLIISTGWSRDRILDFLKSHIKSRNLNRIYR